jgi:uncharacterized membrane protein YgcG
MARYLGLDWDHGHLHLVSATVRGHTVKVHKALGWAETENPSPENAAALGHHLKARLKEAGLSGAPLFVSVGRERIILKHLRYPAIPEKEEAGLVRFQAVKELTDSPEDVVIDYTPVGQRSGLGEYQSLAPIIRKNLIHTYQVLAQAAGLKLAGVVPRPFCIASGFSKVVGATVLTPPPEPADAPVALVVLGEGWGEFSVVSGQDVLLSRTLPVGNLDALLAEVRRNFTVYNGQSPVQPIHALYVTGVNSSEVHRRLLDVLAVPIHPFDPFAGAESLELPVGNRGSFAGAAGVLHARARSGGLPINFLEPREPKPERSFPRLAVLAGVLLILLVGGGLAVGPRYIRERQQARLKELRTRDTKAKNELFAEEAKRKKLQALGDWDNVVWLDELYDLAERIPNVNELRIEQITAEPLPKSSKQAQEARLTIQGRLIGGRNSRQQFDTLVERFRAEEPPYSVELVKEDEDSFTLKVKVERRAPSEYTTKIELPRAEEEDGGGRGGRGGFPGRGFPGGGFPGGGFPGGGFPGGGEGGFE